MPSLTTIQICLQLPGCMPVVVDTHQTWICQLQSGCPVTCNRNILSNKQPRSLESNCSNFFNRPCVNLLSGDASYVGAGKGLCVGVDGLSISTVVQTLVNLAMVAQCSESKRTLSVIYLLSRHRPSDSGKENNDHLL